MPRSDTWPGGIVLDTMKEMDSAGSCDSVDSINSGFSDDSLEHLSAEERACLMFLEETIEALETEEDSGLSNDEPDQPQGPGNLVTRMANLSASMTHSKVTDVSICHKAEPMNKISKDHNKILNYLVPTPLVLANGSSSVLSKVRKGGSFPKPTTAAVNIKAQPTVPSEVNVVVIPPPVKWNSSPMTAGVHPAQWEQRPECPSPRGVLSYEGLVQLRKTTSMKRVQEASQTPETQDKQLSKPIKHILLDDKSPHAQADQSAERKPSPPVVAPKPKKIPSNIASPQTDKTVMNPQKVRMEALYKLGLLKDQESSSSPSPRQPYHSKWVRPHGCPPPPPRSTPSSVPKPPHSKPPTVPATVEAQTRQTHWTNGVVHHRSLSDLTPSPRQLSVKSATGKSATLEHSGLGLGSSLSGQNISVSSYRDAKNNLPQQANTNGVLQNGQPSSSALDMRKHWGVGSSSQSKSQESGAKGYFLSQSVAQSMLMVPRMGEDRREALRKLGLLKD